MRRDDRLAADIGACTSSPVGAGSAAGDGRPVRALGALSTPACMAGLLWALLTLIDGLEPLPCPVPFVMTWALVPCVVAWVCDAMFDGKYLARVLLACLVVTGCVAGTQAGVIWEQLGEAWQAIAQGVAPNADTTLLVTILSTLGCACLCLSVYVAHVGWLLPFACLLLVGAYPELGGAPSPGVVACTAICSAGLFARGVVIRQHARPDQGVLLCVACAALCLCVAFPVARHAFDALSRLPQLANEQAARAISNLQGGVSDRLAAHGAASGQAGTPTFGGTVNRGNLYLTHEELFQASLSERPGLPTYLRAFTGGTYRNGTWSEADEQAFLDAQAVALGTDAATLGDMLGRSQYAFASAWVGAGLTSQVVTLRDVGSDGLAQTLVPYAAQKARPSASGGDGAASRSFDTIEMGTYRGVAAIGALQTSWTSSDETFTALLGAYGQWVYQAYLDVDRQSLPRLTRLVEENPLESLDEIVDFVTTTLSENATYTNEPGTFPLDVEIPEYLLFEGHRGYCQHFATTAVLMFRLYGVPARYVTGYALPASSFERSQDGTWDAVATDARGHAWVEIYTPQLGWVPVEVTPAGSADAAPYATNEAAGGAHDEQATQAQQDEPLTEQPASPSDSQAQPGESQSQQADEGGDGPAQPADGQDEPDRTDGAQAGGRDDAHGGTGGPSAPLVAALVGGAALLTGTAGVLIARARRRRILAERQAAPADRLLDDALGALHAAGMLLDVQGTEDYVARRLAEEVPGLAERDATHLVEQAMRASFGPSDAPQRADEVCRQAYRRACTHARDALGPLARLSFAYLHAYL